VIADGGVGSMEKNKNGRIDWSEMELLTASAANVDRTEAVSTLATLGSRRTRDVIVRETIRCSSNISNTAAE